MKAFLKNKKIILISGLIFILGIAAVLSVRYITPMTEKNKSLASTESDLAGMAMNSIRPSALAEVSSIKATASGEGMKMDAASSGGETGSAAVSSSEASKSFIPPSQGGNPTEKKVEIKAGQLTAGEWDDLDNWTFWSDLMNKKEYADFQNQWGFSLFNHYSVMVKNGDAPIVDAKVILKDNNNKIICQARTNNKGQADLFTGSFQQEESKNLNITVETSKESKTLSDVKLDSNNALVIKMESNQDTSNILDLMFVMDTTGSMSDELEYLKSELKYVIQKTRESNGSNLNIRLSCNYYRDNGDEYVTRPFEFTENIDDVINQISSQRANGGGDYEESVEVALDNAISKHSWSENARARLLFLVLDAPPHHTKAIVEKLQKTVDEAAAKGIRIIPVASSGVDKETEFILRFCDIATGGTYVFLTNDSGIGDSHIEPTIGKYDVQMLNELLIKTINDYISK